MRLTTTHIKRLLLLTLVISGVTGLLITPLVSRRRNAPTAANHRTETTMPTTPTQAREIYGQIPMSFEANQGQTEGAVNFMARGAGYSLFLKPAEAVFVLARQHSSESAKPRAQEQTDNNAVLTASAVEESALTTSVLRMKLVGADASALVEGAEELSGKINYIKGVDAEKWQTNIPTYGRVRYKEVYPGIDVVYYGNQKQLEYDFVVAPGRDARAVSLEFDGADKVEVDARGDLLLTLGDDVIRQPKPFVYQEVAGARRAIEGSYAIAADGRVGFAVGEYDVQRPLVIDPVLVYSTYLGGSGGEQGLAIAVDSADNAYISGFTLATDFPTVNAIQATNAGFQDAFVTKINAAGSAIVYSTYLGGNSHEQSRGIAVDSAGNAYVVGFTNSPDFPTANAIQATKGSNGDDAFVTKLNATGSALIYSTFLGGADGPEFGESVAVDSAGNAYVTGSTFSNDFPTLNAIQATRGSTIDAYLTKINAEGSALVYSTYLGGDNSEIGHSVAVDAAGNAYVTGDTASTNFPTTVNAIQGANGGGDEDDVFVTKVDAAGSTLVYSTYLGGNQQDGGEGITADSAGNAYVTGFTTSANFPVTGNAIQGANGGTTLLQDAFVTKINATGSAMVYSTYLGGTGGEVGFGIAVDSAGNAYVVGGTGSNNTFPTSNALQCSRGGGTDSFITKLNAAGSAFLYSTYLGGNDNDEGRGIALDSAGNAYITGSTRSTNFPTVNAIQTTFGGDAIFGDAFITKISDASTSTSALSFSPATYQVEEDVTFVNVTVQRTGDTSGAATVDYATANATASERSDYTTALGTLRFAAGQNTATVPVLINEDSYTEGAESFTIMLSNPTGGATLACQSATSATIQINDDATEPSTNVIDDPATFVGQHYHDFLNRQADASGQTFWASQITACGNDAACIDDRRQNVSAAFFLSIEFQNTGYFVFRFYRASFPESVQRPRALPRYREFLRDTQEIGRGVVVNEPGFEAILEANKQNFARRWVQRPDFLAQYPETMSRDDYVEQLFTRSEVTPTTDERNAARTAYDNGSDLADKRARALRSVVESGSVYNKQYNPAFVLIQYFGYLRRNPDDTPDNSFSGYDFWLNKLNQFSLPNEDVRDEGMALSRVKRAEMVRAFLISGEYRGRFGS